MSATDLTAAAEVLLAFAEAMDQAVRLRAQGRDAEADRCLRLAERWWPFSDAAVDVIDAAGGEPALAALEHVEACA